jgi:hypothetical protein
VTSPSSPVPLGPVVVDLTSYFGLYRFLNDETGPRWDRGCYYDITMAGLLCSELRMSLPSSDKQGPAVRLGALRSKWEQAREEKAERLGFQHAERLVTAAAADIRTLATSLRSDADFQLWDSWHRSSGEWGEKIERLNGFFEPRFLPMIAVASGRPLPELKTLNETARKNRKSFHKTKDVEDLVLVDLLVRGVYYDAWGQYQGLRSVRHPLRVLLWPHKPAQRVAANFAPSALAELARTLASEARKGRRRIEEWVAAVDLIQLAIKTAAQKWSFRRGVKGPVGEYVPWTHLSKNDALDFVKNFLCPAMASLPKTDKAHVQRVDVATNFLGSSSEVATPLTVSLIAVEPVAGVASALGAKTIGALVKAVVKQPIETLSLDGRRRRIMAAGKGLQAPGRLRSHMTDLHLTGSGLVRIAR